VKKNVLVTGGTGTLGKEIVKQLMSEGYDPLILSSKNQAGKKIVQGDLITGSAIGEAVKNTDVIIHCASDPRNSAEVDIKGTSNLLNAIPGRQNPYLIYISICGVDRSNYQYYQNKFDVERMIQVSGFPNLVIRITQFHDFVLHRILLPNIKEDSVMEVPYGLRFQSIDVKDAARYIVNVVQDKPKTPVVTIGGPQILSIKEMAEVYLNNKEQKYAIRESAVENDFYNIFRSGINLVPEGKVGTITWDAFLSALADQQP
jgi:nucleoside-diphosphate-sugar epimerase